MHRHKSSRLSSLATWLAMASFDHSRFAFPGPAFFYFLLEDVVDKDRKDGG